MIARILRQSGRAALPNKIAENVEGFCSPGLFTCSAAQSYLE